MVKYRFYRAICLAVIAVALCGAGQPVYAQAVQGELFVLINEERAGRDCLPLQVDARLAEAAQIRAQEITRYFEHQRPNGHSSFSVLKELDIKYRSAGENLVYDAELNPAEAVRLWMESPGHRRNILTKKFTHTGIGRAETADGNVYWVQLFIRR